MVHDRRKQNFKLFKLWFIQNNIYSTWSEDLAGQQREYYRCLRLVWTNGMNLISTAVPENLRRDKLIVLTAVGNDGRALQFVTDETLRGDRDIVLAALGNDIRAFRFAAPSLRGDKQFVSAAVEAFMDKNGTEAVVEAIERSQRKNNLVLTVLQSSPLVIESSLPEDKNPYPCDDMLDFQEEEEELQKALKDSELQLQFEVATTKNLDNLIARGNISMLHFSGHGNDKCVYFEHPNGSRHVCNVQDLKDLIEKGGKKLKFAFIATCQSRNVGQAFIEAGVEHVICMERDDDIQDDAATNFARIFYNNLGEGKTIKDAFMIAHGHPFALPEVARKEMAKFALLPELNGGHNITLEELFPDGNSNSPASARPPSLLPTPPKFFPQRQVEMYAVIESMLGSMLREGQRLVRVTGEDGIGKETFCTAVGRYMEKRRMLGEVYWVSCEPEVDCRDVSSKLSQALRIIQGHIFTTKPIDQEYMQISESIKELIEGLLVDEQAVVIIDSKPFKGKKLMLLSRFLSDLLCSKQGVKFLVFHRKGHEPEPPDKEKGFPRCLKMKGVEIELKRLNLKEAVYLFGNHCNFAKNTPNRNWSNKYMVERCSQYFETVKDRFLGDGIPQKIISIAQHIKEPMYNEFVGLLKLSTNEQGSEETSFGRDIGDGSSRMPPPPLKTQDEIREKFVDILQTNGGLYRKSTTSYIRKAIKGEIVITELEDEVEETRVEVTDDTSMVVRSKSTVGEEYVLTRNKFLKYYDESSSEAISEGAKEEECLRQNDFLEYKSKKLLVWAKEVEPTDIAWFRGDNSSSDSANYGAPWGTKDRIKAGDYLVMPQHELNAGDKVEVYRISKDVFKETYVEIANEDSGTKTVVSDDLCTDMESKKKEDRKRKLMEDMRVLKEMEEDLLPEMKEECKAKRLKMGEELLDLF